MTENHNDRGQEYSVTWNIFIPLLMAVGTLPSLWPFLTLSHDIWAPMIFTNIKDLNMIREIPWS